MIADNELEILCIGNALVDVFARGEAGMDSRFGLDNPVQHIPMEKMKEILPLLPDYTACSGGGAANVAKITALLGIKTAFTGALGTVPGPEGSFDEFGLLFEEELKKAGVNLRLIKKSSPSGICLILKMNDHRVKVAASPSAALELNEEDLDSEDFGEVLIRQAKVVVLDGFMLDRRALVQRILALADKHGTVVALDLSAPGLASERALEIITYARVYPLIIFMNEEEAKAFYRALSRKQERQSGTENSGLSPELVKLFKDLTSTDIFPIITVKLGVRGAVVFAGGNAFREETVPLIPRETTGAGDAFCAAFLCAWIRELSLSECAALGNRAAREVLNVNGAQPDPRALKNLGKHLNTRKT